MLAKRIAPLLLCLTVGCGSQAARPAAEKAVMPKGEIIELSNSILATGGADTIQFGRMSAGETLVKTLLLCNTTPQPVVILSYLRSCGCATLEYDSQPIMPKDTLPARLLFDSRGLLGWQFKRIDVMIAGAPKPLRIYIDAEVE